MNRSRPFGTMSTHAALFGIFVVVALAALPAGAQGPGGPNGVEVQIRAENRSTDDKPFCGVGGGQVGDRLSVDAFMATSGAVTGTARFETASGDVTDIDINRLFAFTVCSGNACGGFLLQNSGNQNTVPIWFNDFFPTTTLIPGIPAGPAGFVNVEIPRGCNNTISTFTPGVDHVNVQIKFR